MYEGVQMRAFISKMKRSGQRTQHIAFVNDTLPLCPIPFVLQ
jgi:hypothetical protein